MDWARHHANAHNNAHEAAHNTALNTSTSRSTQARANNPQLNTYLTPALNAVPVNRTPSIRIRRLPSASNTPTQRTFLPDRRGSYRPSSGAAALTEEEIQANRRRSSSEPQRPAWISTGVPPPAAARLGGLSTRQPARAAAPALMSPVAEEPRSPGAFPLGPVPPAAARASPEPFPEYAVDEDVPPPVPPKEPLGGAAGQPGARPVTGMPGMFRRASVATGNMLGAMNPMGSRRGRAGTVSSSQPATEPLADYDDGIVDFLDVVDPEVSTLSTLTNVQNSLFVPDLGRFIDRRPAYTLTRRPSGAQAMAVLTRPRGPSLRQERPPVVPPKPVAEPKEPMEEAEEEEEFKLEPRPTLPSIQRTATTDTITSRIQEAPGRYAVLPEGISLEGWTHAEKEELHDHVRHLLHSRREKFKRSMRGFGQYVRRPLGFLVTLYATLITLFGLAWVLFLIGWISVGSRRDYIVNVIDNVLVALFAIVGDGLAPFRAVDTYHMSFIAHYTFQTWRLRREQNLPKLENHNDLPSRVVSPVEIEEGRVISKDEAAQLGAIAERKEGYENEYSVLTPLQQERLVHHQNKFSKSHTFYKPHETTTHFAFPVKLLVAIVVLLDCHSCLQIALGTCTWAISYHVRPFALTTVILCCSITCNITAGVLISVGDRRTRKKDVIERMFRQQLTEEAIHKLEKRREKERSRNRELGGIDEDDVDDLDEGRNGSSSSGSGSRSPKKSPILEKTERRSMDKSRRSLDNRPPTSPVSSKKGFPPISPISSRRKRHASAGSDVLAYPGT